MRKVYVLPIIIACCISCISISAQDIHFSQFYMSPLNLNPAMTGVMNCNKRAVANYRNQWAPALGSNAYNTWSASYDQKLAVGQNDFFGVGGSLWGDVAGASRFGTTQGRLSFSYSKKMAGNSKTSHHLVVGADAAMTQRRIDPNGLRWPSQHSVTNPGTFDPGLPGGIIAENSITYADLSAGLLWFSNLDQENSFYVGAAMHHLNEANVSFLGQTASLYQKITVHGGGQFAMNKKMSLVPGFVLLFQGPHREYNAGSSVRWKMGGGRGNDQHFQLGLWYRAGVNENGGWHSDALIVSSRFDYKSYGFGFSYDWTLSDFSDASVGNGSFEFSLTYLLCGDQSRGVYCPTF